MGLDGECPNCGIHGPLEIFTVVVESKQCIKIVSELPSEVSSLAIYYLSLFRPESGRGVSVNKAVRLLKELAAELAKGYVQYDRKVARNCPPRIWAEAIQVMLDQRAGLKLPMPNHRYLIKVAWGKADEADRANESSVRNAEQHHQRPTATVYKGPQPIKSILQQYIDGDIDQMPGDNP